MWSHIWQAVLFIATSATLATARHTGHTDPPNLAAVDCAVGVLAAEFAATRFPNDAVGISAEVAHALHVDEAACPGRETPAGV